MKIRELAQKTGVTVYTIRFYEKQELLDASHYQRAANGYRHYGEAAVQRLTLIRRGRLPGLREVRITL